MSEWCFVDCVRSPCGTVAPYPEYVLCCAEGRNVELGTFSATAPLTCRDHLQARSSVIRVRRLRPLPPRCLARRHAGRVPQDAMCATIQSLGTPCSPCAPTSAAPGATFPEFGTNIARRYAARLWGEDPGTRALTRTSRARDRLDITSQGRQCGKGTSLLRRHVCRTRQDSGWNVRTSSVLTRNVVGCDMPTS